MFSNYLPRLRSWHDAGNFVIFVLPSTVLFTAIVFAPIVWTLWIGLTNERATRQNASFIGLDNYITLTGSTTFHVVLMNTIVITMIVVVGCNILGVGIALLLRKETRLYSALRSVFFTPVILSSVVVSVIWRSLLIDDGLLNTMLRALGIQNTPGWLSDPSIALYSMSGIIVWQMLGFAVVVYLAGLAGIPKEIDEAAELEGATGWDRFRYITWPLLAPSFTINTIILMISAFKVYDQIAVLTNGGPGTDTTTTIAYKVVQTAFMEQRAGYASAMAGLMLIIIAFASTLTLRILQRREVAYQ